VTYKTAWRMGQQSRKLMGSTDEFEILKGHVELDEAYVGGRRSGKRGRGAEGKTIVMGMAERGGKISTISTDELISYSLLEGEGFKHGTVKHGQKEWSYYDYRHDAVHNTNRVESFWRLFKKSVASTHIHISAKYADRYLGEFAFRSNHRVMGNAMFDLLIASL
jgi:transposase